LTIKPAWQLADLKRAALGRAKAWVSPSVLEKVSRQLEVPVVDPADPLADVDTLIVIGGGTLIDRAKVAAKDRNPVLRLIAIPSLWGSGAEASPIVVLEGVPGCGTKEIRLAPQYQPDERVIWPELANSISPNRARHACGDCWAHALEGFLSPLADAALRQELAALMRQMLDLPLAADPRWFELSARACNGQSRSSVGLMHGIAHTIEGPLRVADPDGGWGHAAVIANLFLPVLDFDRRTSTRCDELATEYDLDLAAIGAIGQSLVDAEAYARLRPLIVEHWKRILRDPCTRTNCALVRPKHVDHFLTWSRP
jgi:alcohol dehydrogenase class IV